MGNFRTPLIASQRADGSTFYTFSSAIEDIGLNINERNNKVRLSHYVVLDIPELCFTSNSNDQYVANGVYDVNNLFVGTYKDRGTKYAAFKEKLRTNTRDWFKIGLQNYMMNMETTLRNQGGYDFSTSASVTERCFWKFMRKSGAFIPSVMTDDKLYFHEDWSTTTDASVNPADRTLIKGFGTIETTSQSSNQYNINNETYVMIPSSYGQMKYLMQPVEDNNYIARTSYEITSESGLLEGHKDSEIAGSDSSVYYLPLVDNGTTYSYEIGDDGALNPEIDAKKDMLQMVFDTDILRDELAPDSDSPTISYDDLASKAEYILASKYKFNAILLYYTIYDSVGNKIATNLFGILVLNDIVNFSEDTTGLNGRYRFDEIVKYKSNNGKVGSSHFFRVNMKTASIYDSTNSDIIDYSSGEGGVIQDFGDVVANLKQTVDILTGNAVVFNNLYQDVTNVKNAASEAILKINDMQKSVDDLMTGNVRTLSADTVTANVITADEAYIKDLHVDNIFEVSHKDLVSMAKNGKLTPGLQYRINNYITKTTMAFTDSAEHPFDIIVTADSAFTINENARAVKSTRDIDNHFGKSNLAAWKLKYCLTNDTKRFAWADSNYGTGVIYYMEDEFGNKCPYDFKNIQFLRYRVHEDYRSKFNYVSEQYICTETGPLPYDNVETPKYYYTFTQEDVYSGNISDMSLNEDVSESYLGGKVGKPEGCRNNSIKDFYITVDIDGTTYIRQALNNIVAKGQNSIVDIDIDAYCSDITVVEMEDGGLHVGSRSHSIILYKTNKTTIHYECDSIFLCKCNSITIFDDVCINYNDGGIINKENEENIFIGLNKNQKVTAKNLF